MLDNLCTDNEKFEIKEGQTSIRVLDSCWPQGLYE